MISIRITCWIAAITQQEVNVKSVPCQCLQMTLHCQGNDNDPHCPQLPFLNTHLTSTHWRISRMSIIGWPKKVMTHHKSVMTTQCRHTKAILTQFLLHPQSIYYAMLHNRIAPLKFVVHTLLNNKSLSLCELGLSVTGQISWQSWADMSLFDILLIIGLQSYLAFTNLISS